MKISSFGSRMSEVKFRRATLYISAVIFLGIVASLIVVGLVTKDFVLPIVLAVAMTLTITIPIKPVIGIVALVVLLPFNGLVSQLLETPIESISFGALKDLILLLLLVGVARSRRWRNIRAEVVVLVGIIMVFSLISAVWSSGFVSGAYGWRNDFEPLLLLLCVPVLVDQVSIKKISTAMAAVGQLSAAVSIVTWAIGLPWLLAIGRLPVAANEQFPHALFTVGSTDPRAFSPYVAPNEMAVAVTIIIAVIWSRQDWRVRTRALLTVLPATAVILSSSRSGQIGMAIVFAALIARWLYLRRPSLSFGFLGVGAVLGTGVVVLYMAQQVATRIDPSLLGHAASIQEALPIILRNPLGIGLGNVGPRASRFADSPYTVESFWLLLAIESGLIALIVFVALLARVCIIGIRANTTAAYLAVTAVLGSLVSQLVLPTLQEGAVSFTLWIAVSLGLASAQIANQERTYNGAESLKTPTLGELRLRHGQ